MCVDIWKQHETPAIHKFKSSYNQSVHRVEIYTKSIKMRAGVTVSSIANWTNRQKLTFAC